MYAEKLKVPETLSFVLSKFVIVIVPIDVLVSGLKEENAPLIEPIAVSKYCNKLKLLLSVLAGKVPTEGFIIWREIDFPLLVNPLIINWSPNAVSEKSPMVWAATKLVPSIFAVNKLLEEFPAVRSNAGSTGSSSQETVVNAKVKIKSFRIDFIVFVS